MKNERKNMALRICAGLFMTYCVLMIWLLFIRGRIHNNYYVNQSYNLIPFQTLNRMGKLLQSGTSLSEFAFRNIFGNILLFVPLGVFFPLFWQRQRRFAVFFATVSVLIALVEILQMVTAVGVLDIDDWIANVFGGCLGFFLWRSRTFCRLFRH